MPGLPVHHQLPEFAETHVYWVSNAIQPFHPLLPLLLLPSIFPSIRVFPSESVLHIRWPKYWSFSISPSSTYSGLISFRNDWFDPLAFLGTLKRLLQHHSSKALILQCSSLFMAQLSHLYMTTGKTIALTIQTFVGKVMSQLFNMLSRIVMTFLSRGKCLLIAWPQSPFTVIWEPRKIKPVTVSIISSSIFHEVMELDAMNLLFGSWVLSLIFYSPFPLLSRGSFFAFCHYCGFICIVKVIDISLGSLDSSLSFIQSAILPDVLYI